MMTLIRAECLLILRDTRAFAAGLLMVFLVGLGPHLLLVWMGSPPDLAAELVPKPEEPVAGDLVWSVEGPRPTWLEDEGGDAPQEEALVRFWTETGSEAGVHFEVLGLVPGARLDDVADAVKEQAFAERQRRAEEVGQVGPWEETLDLWFVESPVPPVPLRWPAIPPGAALVLLAATMGSLSWVMDAVPRARSGGWLESLAVLPLGRGHIALAWFVVAGGMALLGAAVGLLGHLLGQGFSGHGGLGTGAWLIPLTALLLVPLQVLAFLTASDLRASVMRSLWVLPGFSLLVGAALGLAATHPAWVAWVPVGGLVVASLGLVGPGALPLTLGIAIVFFGGCAWACVRVLEVSPSEVSAVNKVAGRRARGNWFPEAGLLVAIGVASVVAWSPGLWGQDVVRVLLTSHLLFYALPALVAPWLLGLPTAELLPRRWPGVGVLVLSALGVGATLGFGVLITALQQALMPMDPFWTDLVERTFLPLSSGWTLLLIALLPGVCEELLFRGAVLGLLRKGLSGPWAVVLQAVFFALAHLYGFRLLPTFGVGLATGWLVWRTGSLIPAMVLHTLHNGLAATLSGKMQLDLGEPMVQAGLVGVAVMGVMALALAGRSEVDPR